MTSTTLDLVPLEQIRTSPTNPRRTFPDTDDLVESVRRLGVLQPVLVRPTGDHYELVFGERRFRAATDAGLPEIPAMVREMDDEQVLEAQLVENMQREDVHPLEEAEALERLMQRYGHTADDLAAKLGRSKTYVYQRLKLLDLCEEGRNAFLAGLISPTIALLLARVPVQDLQREAIAVIEREQQYGGWTTARARDWIRRNFMLTLAEAPFPSERADLLEDVGSCAECPLRTGNQPNLFPEVDRHDLCTSPPCYQRKADAAWEERKNAAKAAGLKVLTQKQTDELFPWRGAVPDGKAFLSIDSRCKEHHQHRPWSELLPEDARPDPDAIARRKDGEVVELFHPKTLKAAAKAARVRFKKPKSAKSGPTQAEKDEVAAGHAAAEAAVREIVDQVETGTDSGPIVRAVLTMLIGDYLMPHAAVAKRRGLEVQKGSDGARAAVLASCDGMTLSQLHGLLAELLASRVGFIAHAKEFGSKLVELAEVCGVDLAELWSEEQRAVEELRAAQEAEKAAKPKPAKKATKRSSKSPKGKAKRKNPWANLTPEQRLARVNAIRAGRGLPPKKEPNS